jgi:hypothetical protein
VLTAGCVDSVHNWHRVALPPTALADTLLKGRCVQIWSPHGSGAPVYWKEVVISHDSVSGMRLRKTDTGPVCDVCPRRSLPLSAVDSIWFGSLNGLGYVSVAALVASAVALRATMKM